MPAVAGPLESVTIAGRSFAVTSDADVSRKLGGFENETQPNGDGTSRIIKSRVSWMLGGVVVEVDDTLGDQEFLQNIQDSSDFVPITVTYVTGVTYQGTGTITGENTFSNQSTTASFDLSGSGKLTPQ